jgi:PHD/YefM family antitoxin component YafN of YafNO toxin-antitoxin module
MIRTTVEALGGAQAVPSELIPARELHQHLINQVATGTGNVVLADTAGKPAAVVMSIQRYENLVDELNTLRRNNSDDT